MGRESNDFSRLVWKFIGATILNMMKVFILLAMLVLAAIPMVSQIATGVHIVQFHFKGDTRLNGLNLRKCASDLKQRTYTGAGWSDSLVELIKERCLQDKGYF